MNSKRALFSSTRHFSVIPANANILKADIRFVGHHAQLVDIYTSFARQAAQAMKIVPSKTIYPVKVTPDQPFMPEEFTMERRAEVEKDAKSLKDTRSISFEYDRWTVNKSPFVHGRHQDQFEIRTYQRDIKLFDADTETIKRWLHYVTMNLPFGVGIEYALHDYHKTSELLKKEDKVENK